MTEAELAAIEARWSGGAHVEMERVPEGAPSAGRIGVRVPHAGDVPALIAEVRRLRELEQAIPRVRELLHEAKEEATMINGKPRVPLNEALELLAPK